MAKSKNRTKEIEYAVKYLHESKQMPINKIALELGIAEAIVDGIVNQQPEPKPQKISKTQNLMIRHTSSKKNNSVSIMTEAASQLNDELKKKNNTEQSQRFKNSIFRPNG